jgi:hypothetical protein
LVIRPLADDAIAAIARFDQSAVTEAHASQRPSRDGSR